MNKRKFFGTIIGLIFWSICIMFFTYAYYDWKSESTNVVLGIEDLSVECLVGANVEVNNIGPVLNYQDGVKTEFSINNEMSNSMAIELYLDITSISDVNLLTDSLKYVLVADSTGGTNYDYDNPIREGNFSNFDVGNNLITQDLEVFANITTNYQFIIYIDGNMYNAPNMQENSIIANLMIGNCDGSSIPYDELVYQAIYSDTDKSLTFVHTNPLAVGDIYNNKVITTLYIGFTTTNYTSASNVPWYKDGNYQYIETVNFESVIKPKSTAYWFYKFSNLKNIDLSNLDTSCVSNMAGMFGGCSSLIELDLSNFDTSNVTILSNMFSGCSSLVELDLSNFNTSNVTNMSSMFEGCSSLTSLDLSNFDTSNVTAMNTFAGYSYGGMFRNCSSLISLNLSGWNTSKVKTFGNMFSGCSSLAELDLSNFDTSSVTDLGGMFYKCSSLINLDLSSFNTSKVTNMIEMFYSCGALTSLDLSNFDTSNVTTMRNMFSNCQNLSILDVAGFDTSKVTTMQSMFYSCSNLTSLDVSYWNTGCVTNFYFTFYGCSSLINLDVSNWNTSSATTMQSMFNSCSNLTSLDVSNWNTSNVTNMGGMFYNCASLTTEITIMNIGMTTYIDIFRSAATTKDSDGNYIGKITINYIPDNPNTLDINESTESLVEAMIATKSTNSNVVKGCYGEYCPVET